MDDATRHYLANKYYLKFADRIEIAKKLILVARKDFNYELKLNQNGEATCKTYDIENETFKDEVVKCKPFRKKEKLYDLNAPILVFVCETGFQVVGMDAYNKFSKALKNKLDKNYILY